MVVYEVNLDVDADLFPGYRTWLDEHVHAMIALPGFAGAQIFERTDPPPPANRRSFCVHYKLNSVADLDRYLREDAARMRADGQERFAGRFTASRRILIEAD